MTLEQTINPAGQGDISSVTHLKRAAEVRARMTARIITANAQATETDPITAILKYGSVTVYKAS